jgi:hypothetical protein
LFVEQWYDLSDFIGVGPGKQIAVGTGEFEDIKCGYTKKPIKLPRFLFVKIVIICHLIFSTGIIIIKDSYYGTTYPA